MQLSTEEPFKNNYFALHTLERLETDNFTLFLKKNRTDF